MVNKTLYKEFTDGKQLTANEQEWYVMSSNLVEATQDEIDLARERYSEVGKCDYHLIYDVAGFPYDERICDICGHHVAWI